MCSICGFLTCPSGCPNADEPDTVFICEHCKDGITVGETYYAYDGCYYHEDCFEEIAVELLMKDGAEKREADESDIDDGSDYAYESWRDERLFG